MLVAHLPQPPTRAEQRALSDSLTCRLFADAGQVVAADDIGRTIYGKPQLRDSRCTTAFPTPVCSALVWWDLIRLALMLKRWTGRCVWPLNC